MRARRNRSLLQGPSSRLCQGHQNRGSRFSIPWSLDLPRCPPRRWRPVHQTTATNVQSIGSHHRRPACPRRQGTPAAMARAYRQLSGGTGRWPTHPEGHVRPRERGFQRSALQPPQHEANPTRRPERQRIRTSQSQSQETSALPLRLFQSPNWAWSREPYPPGLRRVRTHLTHSLPYRKRHIIRLERDWRSTRPTQVSCTRPSSDISILSRSDQPPLMRRNRDAIFRQSSDRIGAYAARLETIVPLCCSGARGSLRYLRKLLRWPVARRT